MNNLDSVELAISSHPILKHRFLEELKAGHFSKEQIAIWIGQQFYFSNQFPCCLAALYARIGNSRLSKPLMSFLQTEHWGSEEETAHWKSFVKVLDYFGLTRLELENEKPFDETKEYLDFRLNLCLRQSVQEGLGAIGFGHEFVNSNIFKSYLDGMRTISGISEEALIYFTSHVEDEKYDYEIFKNIMIPFSTNSEGVGLIKKGAEDVLAARYTFFDKILSRISSISS